MSVSFEFKKQFLTDFQNKIVQGRKLLKKGNHRWAAKLLRGIYFDIEKSEWLDMQKKHQLITIISNSWWLYINRLSHQKTAGSEIDYIRYIDAYKRFFSFLSQLDDFYLFNSFATKLLKQFIGMEELSIDGITKFINSYCVKVNKKDDYQKLTELQILLMFLRKSVIPNEFFSKGFEKLGRVIFKLEPGKRAIFLYTILENVNLEYNLMENSEEFIKEVNKILINRIPSYLKEVFSNLSRISINERTYQTIREDLEGLVYYLNDIGEHSWIILIIRNLYEKIKKYKSFGDAVSYIRNFIDFAIKRNRFEIAFEIYDLLENIFLFKGELGYDNILIELWVEACKKFVDMKEKKFLLQSLDKLNNHLKIPQTKAQIFHYFYTSNYLWKFKSRFFSLEKQDFWRMMFYRALYEEKNFTLAKKIIPYLKKNVQPLLHNVEGLYEEAQTLKKDIYRFENSPNLPLKESDFTIKQIILRINEEGKISYRLKSLKEEVIEGTIIDEYWNDAQIIEIYNDLFSESEKKEFEFNLRDFGRLCYIFLPKLIRKFFSDFKVKSLNYVPQIYFILDNMTIPFDLIYDNNFFLLKYSIGYKIGEAPLGGITFKAYDRNLEELKKEDIKYNAAIIESLNSKTPKRWNERTKKKELIFPFPAGANELNYITNFFNSKEEISQIEVMNGIKSSKQNILQLLSHGKYNIIHFVGNIFYSGWSPKESFFRTNDNSILKFSEISDAINKNDTDIHPFLFFNSQIYNIEGKKLNNVLEKFGEIVAHFDYDKIAGIMSRNYPIFNEDTKSIISNFYINLFDRNGQGIALLKARQSCIADKTVRSIQTNLRDLRGDSDAHIDVKSSLAISSYLLFGKPWKPLI
ncbi:MAG: hypothetical protein BAJALOKI2v1_90035 [Promethearchaeota archaeon]|nr:MAG: hypothetical protein BAJALOKI2v1_90035 [Candidatus Lokiarchaeota archaeon]